jgi:hypothetical protein
MTDTPLTGEELAAIKATALRLHGGEVGYFPEHIERLRAQVAGVDPGDLEIPLAPDDPEVTR